jgi:hypothetical protein
MLKTLPISPPAGVMDLALERRLERLGLAGKESDWTDQYLLCHHLGDSRTALRGALLVRGDYYVHRADLTAYPDAQARAGSLYVFD